MVTKSFVSEVIGINMLDNTGVQIQDPSWGEYKIQVINFNTDDELFQVLNRKDEPVKAPWQTVEGATAHCELLAGGYWKES